MKRISQTFLSIALALGASAVLTGTAVAQGAPQKGGTAIIALGEDPQTVNPNVTTNIPSRIVGCILYQGMVEVSPDYKILPLLAKSWQVSPDGLTYSFDLVKAEWHDGKPFTSADVKYSLLEVSAKLSALFNRVGKLIDNIDTPAADKVVIKLKEPFGPFLISLGCIQGAAILPSHLFAGTDPLKNPASIETPVGTGPFKLTEWRRADFIRLAKNDKYHEPGKPHLDGIIGKVIPQVSTALQALRAGEVDYVSNIPPNDVAAIVADPKLKVLDSDNAPISTLAFFNMKQKPLNDKRVRHALMMAIDREYLMKNVFFNIGTVGVQPFTTDIPWVVNAKIDYRKMYPFDVAKANALLDEAGIKRDQNGKRFSMNIAVFAALQVELQQVAVALKSMWEKVGVDVTVTALETATYIKRVFQDGEFQMSLVGYTSYSDPALGIVRTFDTSSIGRPFGNASFYSNPKVDAMFTEGEKASAPQERGKHYNAAQEIIAEDLPVIQLRSYLDQTAATKKLNGIWRIAQGNGRWADGWLAK